MWRNIASNTLTLLILAALAVAGLIAWGQRQFTTPGPLAEAVFFEVPRGASLRQVSQRLAAEGVIRSAPIFRIGADYADLAGELKFGTYEIPPGASMADILDILTRGGASSFRYAVNYVIGVNAIETRVTERTPGTGETVQIAAFAPGEMVPEVYADLLAEGRPMAYRVTVAPGTTVWQVAEGLRQAEFLEGETGELPPEGMLAPDSYELRRGAERAQVIADMAAAQAAILGVVWDGRAADLPIATAGEALILASIIEKETGVPGERGQVASVFVNRLRRGMRLQTDPAVIYGVTRGQGVLGRGLRQSELQRETPWNTYVIDGLPPTPIANPSRASLEAAVNPPETDLLYFVADGSGGHAFARTLEEHNRNVTAWRRIEAQRQRD